MLIELEIHSTANTNSADERAVVVLKEKGGERLLPVMMSMRRAMVVAMRSSLLVPLQLPVSIADVGCMLMSKFGVRIARIELTAIKDGTFFCRVVAEREGEEQSVDFCQAPDGLVIAAVAHCPIMIEETLLDAQYMQKTGDHSFALNINVLTRSMLEEALKHAIENENYEAASHLRDELAKRTKEKKPE